MKVLKVFPGIILSVGVALLACWLESLLPIHLIGSAVIAMFIGMFLNHFLRNTKVFASGLKFTSKKILKFAIILLGLSLNITTILNVGKMSLTVMIFTLLTCFGGGYFIGKALGLNWKLSNLISAGTGICGGSAIAAIAPTIDADDNDVAYVTSRSRHLLAYSASRYIERTRSIFSISLYAELTASTISRLLAPSRMRETISSDAADLP